jgi:hypothetical protein
MTTMKLARALLAAGLGSLFGIGPIQGAQKLAAADPKDAALAQSSNPPAGSSEASRGAAAIAPPSAPPAIDFAKLRADYDKLRDDLFRARARAELVEGALYAAKLGATLRWKGAPDFILRRAEIRLDGTEIWDSGEKPLVDDRIKVSERPIKPGPHAITVRIEVRPGKKAEKERADLGYESEQTFVVDVPDQKRTTVEITGDDDGDLPGYEPEIEVDVESEK